MNWFKNIFGFVSKFFSRAAKTAIGVAAESISEMALEVVNGLESNGGLSGVAKKDLAIDLIKEKYPDIQTAAINLAIETALAIIRDIIKKS